MLGIVLRIGYSDKQNRPGGCPSRAQWLRESPRCTSDDVPLLPQGQTQSMKRFVTVGGKR